MAVRRHVRILATASLALALLLADARVLRAQPAEHRLGEPRALAIERIEFVGLTRTSASLAERVAGLELPARATPEVIRACADRLRAAGLFRSVEVHTRPGTAAGDVVLVMEVVENRPHLRFGLGYEDFSSWYLIPAQLDADNLTGRGEQLRLSARVGYRVSGLDLRLRRPSHDDVRDFWELRLGGETVDRVYWLDSTEAVQRLQRGGLEFRLGRGLSHDLALEGWLATERSEVDSAVSVYSDRASLGRSQGDPIAFATLPIEIQRDVRERAQTRFGSALTLDRRIGAAIEARGVWARVSGEGVFSQQGDFGSWQADVRGYAPLGTHVQLAARVRAGALSANAPFHERYYVGGLYTVRGYPSQSLSPPQGTLNLGAGSLELRSVWWGPAADPRFTGIVFLDGATGWNRVAPTAESVRWGAGFGFRARIPWLGQAGVDIAAPLSDSPVEEAFHVNAVLGWTF